MKYSKPVSVGRLRKLYKIVTGITSWNTIYRGSGGKTFKKEAYDNLGSNNYRLMLRDIRAWLDKFEKEKL